MSLAMRSSGVCDAATGERGEKLLLGDRRLLALALAGGRAALVVAVGGCTLDERLRLPPLLRPPLPASVGGVESCSKSS